MDESTRKDTENTNEVKPTEENMQSQVKSTSDREDNVVVAPKKKRHLGLFFALLLTLVVLALITGFLMSDSTRNKAAAPGIPQQTTKEKTSTKTTDIAALLAGISDNLQGSGVKHDKVAPDFIVPGYSFAAVGSQEDSSNVTFQRADTAVDATMTKLENNLTGEGFKKSAVQVKEPYWGLVKYENTDTICGISTNRPESDASQMKEVYLACALKDTYKATAKVQKPFYDAYTAARTDYPDQDIAYPRISDSRTRGYKTAEAGLYGEGQPTGAMGLFYQTPDQTWHYFMGTQQIVSCSKYDTPDLKKAYLGEQCFESANTVSPSTVQL